MTTDPSGLTQLGSLSQTPASPEDAVLERVPNPHKDTPYLAWIRKEGLDVISALYVKNLYTVELKPWSA